MLHQPLAHESVRGFVAASSPQSKLVRYLFESSAVRSHSVRAGFLAFRVIESV